MLHQLIIGTSDSLAAWYKFSLIVLVKVVVPLYVKVTIEAACNGAIVIYP